MNPDFMAIIEKVIYPATVTPVQNMNEVDYNLFGACNIGKNRRTVVASRVLKRGYARFYNPDKLEGWQEYHIAEEKVAHVDGKASFMDISPLTRAFASVLEGLYHLGDNSHYFIENMAWVGTEIAGQEVTGLEADLINGTRNFLRAAVVAMGKPLYASLEEAGDKLPLNPVKQTWGLTVSNKRALRSVLVAHGFSGWMGQSQISISNNPNNALLEVMAAYLLIMTRFKKEGALTIQLPNVADWENQTVDGIEYTGRRLKDWRNAVNYLKELASLTGVTVTFI